MKLKHLLCLSVFSVVTNTFAEPTIINNVNGYHVVGDKLQTFSSLAFENGKVLATGNAELAAAYKNAVIIDGNGKTLLPGLIDAHGHILGLGESLMKVDLRGADTEMQAAQRAREYANLNPQIDWISGRGWNQVLWPEKRFPTKHSLDKLLPDKPVVLERVDGHALWVNSKALAVAGITTTTPNPVGGEIVRDEAGYPTGVLIDTAMDLVFNAAPAVTHAVREKQLVAARQELLSVGITSAHDAGIDFASYEFYRQKADTQQLGLRIYAMISSFDSKLDDMLAAGYVQSDDDTLWIRSVKGFGDGALGSRGAALLADYSDDPGNRGILVTPEDALPALFDKVLGANFQLNFHAIGDRSNRLILDNFARAYQHTNGLTLRNRIEHAQVVTLDDIPRFKPLNLIASMQPVHATSDMNMAEDRLGKERLKGAYAWQTFAQQGTVIAAGSDFPVELANPFHGLHAAVTRQSHANLPEDGWLAAEKLSREQAFKAFTLDAAYAAHQEEILGNLQPGKYADFILIDRDIFTVPAAQIWQTQVLQTWLAGKQVFTQN
ncbi:amidohydrolase [Bowmanella sp. JS7-9]|uniref:Amidohydrolase n=1 Tax=Pseudobowmanella zhangzhouensis TaxID=1537679 RepID=A0ABW1XH00_9ALTE|nr:amidohydrolase [Bowmanella sp. JS7-9]TBX25735.1 amidohydrolase [Bowmanella sp. JS7-9]